MLINLKKIYVEEGYLISHLWSWLSNHGRVVKSWMSGVLRFRNHTKENRPKVLEFCSYYEITMDKSLEVLIREKGV